MKRHQLHISDRKQAQQLGNTDEGKLQSGEERVEKLISKSTQVEPSAIPVGNPCPLAVKTPHTKKEKKK